MKYYAVKADSFKAIFESWDEAKLNMEGLKNLKYKAFKSKEEAEAFLDDIVLTDDILGPKAYIDGSFDSVTSAYSFGGVLIIDNKEYKFKKRYDMDEFSKYRNVAGEIKGAGYIINYAIKLGIRELHLFYDYQGIEAWYLGTWKANSDIALKYVEFRDSVKDKIKIHFHKIKSHTNNHYNDMADILAKEALGL